VQRWVKKNGRENEDFDCFVGGLYLSIYVLSTNVKTAENRLIQRERKLAQADFFEVLEDKKDGDFPVAVDSEVKAVAVKPVEKKVVKPAVVWKQPSVW